MRQMKAAKLTYTVVVEQAKGNLSAYAPDLPGCVATGRTENEVLRRMTRAIELHLRGLKEDGLPIPKPRTRSREIEFSLSAA